MKRFLVNQALVLKNVIIYAVSDVEGSMK